MAIDLTKMPKLGFGLMRLPENDGVIDHEQVCRMVDKYMDARPASTAAMDVPCTSVFPMFSGPSIHFAAILTIGDPRISIRA